MSAALVEASSKFEIASTVRARRSASAQPGPSGRSRTGSAWTRMSAVELAVEQALLDLLEPAAGVGAREAGSEAGQRADLAGAAGVRAIRDRQHAAALGAAVERLGDLDERVEGRATGAPAADVLAPDHQRLARAQLAGDAFRIADTCRHVLGFACGPVGRGPLAELCRQLVEERRRLAGR